MDPRRAILAAAIRQPIREADFDAGYERFIALTGAALSRQAFADAVAACVADGLILDPVRLPVGALHCHWHLEPTARGRALIAAGAEPPKTGSR